MDRDMVILCNSVWNLVKNNGMSVYIGVLIGAFVYVFLDAIGEVGKGIFSKKYLLALVGNIVAGMALVWAFDLQKGFAMGGIDGARLMAMFFGVAGQKIFKTAIAMADKNVKTTIGINESNQG